jgi:protein TonB
VSASASTQAAQAVAEQSPAEPAAAPEPAAPPQPVPPEMPAPSALSQPAPPPLATASLEPVPRHKPTPPALRKEVQPLPPPVAVAALPEPQQASPVAPPAPAASMPTAAPAAGAGTDEGTAHGGRGRGDEGAGLAAAGNGSLEKPGDDYLELVRRWVARFRGYPDAAIKQREEGTVALGFTFTRDGTVLDAWIEKSSGFPLLDAAALKMIHDASPIPKVPERYKGETLTLVMPETYHIGIFDRIFH